MLIDHTNRRELDVLLSREKAAVVAWPEPRFLASSQPALRRNHRLHALRHDWSGMWLAK